MNKVFNKILERLKEETDCPNCSMYCADANMCGFEEMKKKAMSIVKEVAEEYNGGWIPCSERLPEKYGDYLVAWKPLHMSAEDIIKKLVEQFRTFMKL